VVDAAVRVLRKEVLDRALVPQRVNKLDLGADPHLHENSVHAVLLLGLQAGFKATRGSIPCAM
jgi:hypothetical protein